MWFLRIVLFMLLLSISVVVHAQSEKSSKALFAAIPPSDILLAVASQPNCPLHLEDARLLYNVNTKRLEYEYGFRNGGNKPIVGFQVSAWLANGTGGSLTNDWEDKHETLMPGQMIVDTDVSNDQIVPLTDQIRANLELTGKMRMVIVLFVPSVNFSDGSEFDDSKTGLFLLDYFKRCGNCVAHRDSR
jgi:hypothetical protein